MGPILCPSGTFFDETTASCEEKYDGFVCAADDAGTRTQDTAAPTTSPLEAGPCRPGFTGLTATDKCEGANVCRDGNYLTSIDCPRGSLFDVNDQQCVHWYRNFVCGGIAPDELNEDETKRGKTKTGDKEVEIKDEKNEKNKKAEKDDASSKKSAVVTDALVSPVPMPPPMRPRSRCPKGFSGKVPANEDCSAYIYCERGQYDNLGVVPCRPDDRYVFDFLSQSCKAFGPEEHFECMYTILTTDEEALAEELIAQLHND